MASLRKSLTDAYGRLDARVRRAAPAVELARLNGAAMRAYLRYRGPIESGIGEAEADAYGDVVVRAAKQDGELGRVMALAVPDHLARVPPARRALYFRTLREVLGVRPQAAPLIARTLPDLVDHMDDEALRAFVARGLALHGESTHKAESFLKRESGVGQAAARELKRGLPLSEVSRTLTLYARAHCGEDVQVRPGQGRAFSDGHHVYLPERVDRFGDERDFLLYRVQTAIGAGYLEFGTFDLRLDQLGGAWPDRRDGEAELERFLRAFPNKSLARDLFQVLEDARVEARIRAYYPGVARDLDVLGPELRGPREEPTAPVKRVVEALARRAWKLPELALAPAEAAAAAPFLDALARVGDLDVHAIAELVRANYGGVEVLFRRSQEEGRRHGPSEAARAGADERGESFLDRPALAPSIAPEQAGSDERKVEDEAQRLLNEMREAGESIAPSDARRRVRESQKQAEKEGWSYEDMEAFLERNPGAGGAQVDPEREAERAARVAAAAGSQQDPDATPGARTFVYREWDSAIEDYKPRWVTLREHRLKEGSRAFVDDVMLRERHHIESLRKRFEALRPQGLVRVRNLPDGTDLDIDRVVESAVDRKAGRERGERLYQRDERQQRDVAVAILVDMSSSTNESADGTGRRIIEVEKAALIVAAEALHALGDAFAIWGFSGYGRDHVAFYVAKEFADAWDDKCRERIGRIQFKMENRDGAAIRHATRKLMEQPARVRLLLLLSDGKPLDCGCDHYYDRYAQDDTRAALREARKEGIHPFCVTVDPTGPQYLARMYGDVAYTVIDNVGKLPERLVKVYRRLAL